MHNIIGNVLISLSLIRPGHVSQPKAQDAQSYLPRPSYLANGDPAAGRRDYMALKCNTCHTVAGEPIGTKPPRLPGLQLGKSLGLEPPQHIADRSDEHTS